MAYEKAELQALADKILAMFDAVRDGVGMDDLDEGVALLTAFGAASNEIKTDTDAALLHVAGALLDRVGDRRLDTEV